MVENGKRLYDKKPEIVSFRLRNGGNRKRRNLLFLAKPWPKNCSKYYSARKGLLNLIQHFCKICWNITISTKYVSNPVHMGIYSLMPENIASWVIFGIKWLKLVSLLSYQ